MFRRAKNFANACTVTILLALAYTHEVYSGDITLFKCCFVNPTKFADGNDNGTIGRVEEFILQNNTNQVSRKLHFNANFTIVAGNCSDVEHDFTGEVSLSPNQVTQGFHENGSLQIGSDQYAPSQYCISEFTGSAVIVKTEKFDKCNEDTCIRKCCEESEVYDISTLGVSKLRCMPSVGNTWKPVVYPVKGNSRDGISNTKSLRFKPDHPRNWCTGGGTAVIWSRRTIGENKRSLFRILSNGKVVRRDGIAWTNFDKNQICVDGAINIPGHFDPDNRQSAFSNDELDTIIFECATDRPNDVATAPVILYLVAVIIASLFAFATLVIYGLLWEKQNIHGWTLLGYVATLVLLYASLVASQVYVHIFDDPNYLYESEVLGSFCGIIAIIAHFLYICVICWLTVISFDIFSKFRILKLTATRPKNKVRFLLYLLFTTFVPLVIVSVGLILDIQYGDEMEVNIILPKYGWNKCFLDLKQAALPYLFGPIGVLLFVNCGLYLVTIFHMYKLQESTKFASSNSNQVRKQRDKIRLFSKLFVLMGVNWVFEVATFLAFGTETNLLVVIVDIISILQPVVVFGIFVCKRDIIESLCQKYSSLRRIFSSFEAEECTVSSSSRNTWGWNRMTTTRLFRARINSTMTEISNLSVRSTTETPTPSPLPSPAPLERIPEMF